MRSVAGVIDLSVYKHQASDGNEKSKPGINVLQFSFSVNYVPFFSLFLISPSLIETWAEGNISPL